MGNYFDFHLGKIIVEKWEKCSKTQYIQPKPLFSKKKKKKIQHALVWGVAKRSGSHQSG